MQSLPDLQVIILLQITNEDAELPGQIRIATQANKKPPPSIKILHLLPTLSRFSLTYTFVTICNANLFRKNNTHKVACLMTYKTVLLLLAINFAIPAEKVINFDPRTDINSFSVLEYLNNRAL